MRKLLCACGCGDRVTQKVERRHLNALAPELLASQVLQQNQTLIRRKKRSRFDPLFHQQLPMRNIGEINDEFGMNHAGPSGLTNHPDALSLDSPMTIEENLDGQSFWTSQ